MLVTTETQLNMVIGYPLAHSQSPMLHHEIYQLSDINAVLLAQPGLQLESLIQAIKALSVGLTAVTLPYKEKVIQYLDACSHEVNALRAANTIIQREGKLYGYNTDVDGIAFALRKIMVKGRNVVIIGAGGAARAAAYFLKSNSARIFYMNKTRHKAKQLANEFDGEVIEYSELAGMKIDLFINATPLGLYPHIDTSPLPDFEFSPHHIVFDMVYNPIETLLLKQAKEANATCISGLDMFIGQGLKQVELLSGKTIRKLSMIDKLRAMLIANQQETQR